jgi:hypothetical protein
MQKLFSVAILTLCITILLVYSCDKDKEKSIVGPGEDTYTVSGKVVNIGGYGSIWINSTVAITGTNVDETTISDSLGVFSFKGLSEGVYTLAPTREGYKFFPSSTEVNITDSNETVGDFVGWRSNEDAKTSSIVGKIIDADKKPVFSVHVQIFPNPNPKELRAISLAGTQENGYYLAIGNFINTNKSYQVVPTKEGYNYTFSPDTSYVTPTDAYAVVNFTAIYSGEPLHSISGRIVDAEGKGVVLNILNNCSLRTENGKESYTLITDTEGNYIFTGLKDGTYILSGKLRKNNLGINQEIIIDGKDVIMTDLVLSYQGPTNYEFSGSVLDNSGNGIPGVKVLIPIVGNIETNEEGCYSTGEINYNFQVGEFDVSKSISFIPSKSGCVFASDTTWVTIEWQEGVEFEEITVPDIIGFDWGVYKAEEYFPLGTVTSWAYERTTDGGEPYAHIVSVSGTETVKGLTYTVMSLGYTEYFSAFRIENNIVYTHAENEDKEYLKFGVVKGSDWVIDSIRGNNLTGTFIDIETVSVPVGTFEDCLHFELNLPLGDISYEKTDLWFARDVGLVRAEKVVVSMGEVMETVTDELKSYENK